MEFWGTLQKTLGGGSVASDSDAYVDKFFENTTEEDAWALEVLTAKTNEFVTAQLSDGRRIALVTSGSATVPLTSESVMDAVSFGDRGASSAEHFLQAGYAVIFLHRQGSAAPFSRHFASFIHDNQFISMLRVHEDRSLRLDSLEEQEQDRLSTILTRAKDTKSRLFHITFSTVQQYLYYLRMTSKALDPACSRGLILLSASVLDYYVPTLAAQTTTKKEAVTLNLVRAPNLVRKIRHEYAPKAFLVTLKSVADKARMQSAAFRDIERWGVDVVVADSPMLPDELALISPQEEFIVSPPQDDAAIELEEVCAAMLVELHRAWSARRQILKQGKSLLLLTAKFSMMKENDTLNEDAMGNKNVPFKVGIRIRADRTLGEASPVYELVSIAQNKSHCARAHIWKCIDDNAKEAMIAFSPAGTPETIRSLWGDLWNGWDEAEIADFKEQIGHVTLTSALVGLAQGVTATVGGDYSHAHAMLAYIYSKLGTAWAEGEQTRIRQSFENMVAVHFNRGLTELGGLNDIEELRHAKALSQHVPLVRNNTMTSQEAELVKHGSRRRRKTDSYEVDPTEETIWHLAATVRVHKAIKTYFDEMLEEGIVDTVAAFVREGYKIHVTGYSMGGMLGQLFLLHLGDLVLPQYPGTIKNIHGVFFGTPRVGDAGFAARMKVIYGSDQLLNVMHPMDTVHAYPPMSEGYADAMLKVFLKDDGTNRRMPSAFSVLPFTRAMDKILDKATTKSNLTDAGCSFCHRKDHKSEQHRCRYCTRRGDHRGEACPYRKEGCSLCGAKSHSTGEHRCSVCTQYGHRGRNCHTQSNVGVVELLAYFRFHHYLYYSSNLKKNVEFSSE
ncbi:unnamed protein product [Aphanomyces euteiches]